MSSGTQPPGEAPDNGDGAVTGGDVGDADAAGGDVHADEGVDEDPGERSEADPRPSRRWSRALVLATVAIVAAVTAAQLSGLFFYNAPPNPVSQRYTREINDWMQPLFAQNWHLFAPNPYSENVDVQARASLASTGGTTPWFDLSAQDEARLTGDPAPGHELQNSLRNAWLGWAATHDGYGNPSAPTADVMQQFLLNLVEARLRPLVGGPIGSIDIRVTTTLIPGPGRTAAQTAPQTRTLGWWTVAAA